MHVAIHLLIEAREKFQVTGRQIENALLQSMLGLTCCPACFVQELWDLSRFSTTSLSNNDGGCMVLYQIQDLFPARALLGSKKSTQHELPVVSVKGHLPVFCNRQALSLLVESQIRG